MLAMIEGARAACVRADIGLDLHAYACVLYDLSLACDLHSACS